MKNALILIFLLTAMSSYAKLPNWLKLESTKPIDTTAALPTAAIPMNAVELIYNSVMPNSRDALIGFQLDIQVASKSGTFTPVIVDDHFLSPLDNFVTRIFFKTNLDINLDMDKYIGRDPILSPLPWRFLYNWGDVDARDADFRKIIALEVIEWIDPKTNIKHALEIKIETKTFNNHFEKLEKEVQVKSKSRQPLVRGEIKMTRLAGSSLGEIDHEIKIKDGSSKESDSGNPTLSAGHYKVELMEPSECKEEAIHEDFVVTPDMLKSDKPLEFEIVCSYAYDMTIKGSIITKGSDDMIFRFELEAKEFLTHDEELDIDEVEESSLFFDDEGYPLNSKRERLTLPMRHPDMDPRVYFSSWSEKIEVIEAEIHDYGTGRTSECKLEEGDFGFVRVRDDFIYMPGHTTLRGSYPNLDAKFGCMLEDEDGNEFYMQVPLYIGPLGQFAPGGWWNSFNIPMDQSSQEMLLESGENFFQTYSSSMNKAFNSVDFNMTLEFNGYFTQKEIKKPGTGGGDDGGGDDNPTGSPYIFTDMVSFDNTENEVSLEIMAEFYKVKELDYELFCNLKNGSSKLLKKGNLVFTATLPPYGMGREVVGIADPKPCVNYKVVFDVNDLYPASAFSPSEVVETTSEDDEWK